MGDHQAHSLVFHASQPLYFAALFIAFHPSTLLLWLTHTKGALSWLNLLSILFLSLVSGYLIRHYTYVPFYQLKVKGD